MKLISQVIFSVMAVCVLWGCSQDDASLTCPQRVIDQPHRNIHPVVDCPENAETFLIIGQSNATNWAFGFSRAEGDVYVRHDGACYPARDPLSGGNGGRGSPWPRFGDLRAQHTGRPVVLITRALGDTTVSQWAQCGYVETAGQAVAGLDVDHVFWIQGESDHGVTAPEDYAEALSVVEARLRDYIGQDTLFWISTTSLLEGVRDDNVRAGEALACSKGGQLRCGPDTDLITDRYDNIHFGAHGAAEMAQMWADALAGE